MSLENKAAKVIKKGVVVAGTLLAPATTFAVTHPITTPYNDKLDILNGVYSDLLTTVVALIPAFFSDPVVGISIFIGMRGLYALGVNYGTKHWSGNPDNTLST